MRYYQKKFPSPGEHVVIRVKSFSDLGAYVYLLEYDSIEGMIPVSELSNREVKKATSVGNIEVALVTIVDEEKGYIDLSKKGISLTQVSDSVHRWSQSRWIDLAVQCISREKRIPIEDVYREMVWPGDPEVSSMVKAIQRNSKSHTARVDVMLYRYNKVDSIKEGLLAGLSATSELVSIQVDQSPTYRVTLYSDREEEIHKVCDAIIGKILKLGGEAIQR
jgi:translation initiation factor 2 subunit 1